MCSLDSKVYMVSVMIDVSARGLGPAELYAPDRVASAVRRTLLDWGLGRANPAVPLADIIRSGCTVLLKPNWVADRNAGGGGLDCLYTHPAFVLAVLREALMAQPGRVIIGDAPIQGCNFDALVTATLRDHVSALARQFGVPIDLIDFRRTVMIRGAWTDAVKKDMRPADRFVLFDLGSDSLLEPITSDEPRFRVASYDPRELARTHCRGRHQYLLCREAFEADVVISLPKLKTHCKAGLTGALKNLVGLNGNKDYLPHYRAGGSAQGGDNYEGGSILKRLAEHLEDTANQQIGSALYPWLRVCSGGLKRLAGDADQMGGSWYGNDTVWRMVLDLNRILRYGRSDGTMSDTPQRTFYSLTDAIVCGQGNGPLRPNPLKVGAVTFGASPVACDLVHAALLRLDANGIPLIREAVRHFRWPLVDDDFNLVVRVNGTQVGLEEVVRQFGVDAEMPAGWRRHIESLVAR